PTKHMLQHHPQQHQPLKPATYPKMSSPESRPVNMFQKYSNFPEMDTGKPEPQQYPQVPQPLNYRHKMQQQIQQYLQEQISREAAQPTQLPNYLSSLIGQSAAAGGNLLKYPRKMIGGGISEPLMMAKLQQQHQQHQQSPSHPMLLADDGGKQPQPQQ